MCESSVQRKQLHTEKRKRESLGLSFEEPPPSLTNGEKGREECAWGAGWEKPGQRWPEGMVETQGCECSRETVVGCCWPVRHHWGLQQMRTEE